MSFETPSRTWWIRVSRTVRSFPADLLVVLGLLVLANLVIRVPGLREAAVAGARIRVLVAIPALLVVPGYVLVSALFPGAPERGTRQRGGRNSGTGRPSESIDLVERAALSFGMSVALVPLFALAIGSVWDFSLAVVLNGLTVLVLGGIVIAAVRRLRLPPGERFGRPARRWAMDVRAGGLRADSAFEGAANLALALAVLAAVGAVGYAVATPYQSGQSSTLYLVTENETGSLVASGYPTEFTAGEGQSLTVGVANDGERRQPYTVVIAVERVDGDTGEATVTESQEVDRLHATVEPGQTWTSRHTVAPELVGEDLRLHYYLFERETAPSDFDPSAAEESAYVWINVARA